LTIRCLLFELLIGVEDDSGPLVEYVGESVGASESEEHGLDDYVPARGRYAGLLLE